MSESEQDRPLEYVLLMNDNKSVTAIYATGENILRMAVNRDRGGLSPLGDIPLGLSVWEGKIYKNDDDTLLIARGRFRDMKRSELAKIRVAQDPFGYHRMQSPADTEEAINEAVHTLYTDLGSVKLDTRHSMRGVHTHALARVLQDHARLREREEMFMSLIKDKS